MISLRTVAICAAAITAVAPATGFADTFKKYGDAEGWNVFVDAEKLSCLIEKTDAVGNVVQMGLTADRGIGYVGVFTKGETTIQKDQKEAVAIMVGGNFYVGEVTGMRGNITEGYSGGYVLSNDPKFVDDIARQYEMQVFPEKEYSFVVDLTGTMKAIDLARECNAAQLR